MCVVLYSLSTQCIVSEQRTIKTTEKPRSPGSPPPTVTDPRLLIALQVLQDGQLAEFFPSQTVTRHSPFSRPGGGRARGGRVCGGCAGCLWARERCACVIRLAFVSQHRRLAQKLNILSFALASDAGDRTTPVSDQRDCAPPPPALLTQDSMPRERRHLAGVTREGGSVFAFFFVLSGECSLGAHGLLRFRTNDVLLGTSGVGCAYLLCLVPPVFFFYFYAI